MSGSALRKGQIGRVEQFRLAAVSSGEETFFRSSFRVRSIPRGVHWVVTGVLCCCGWAEEDVYWADI